MEDIPSEDREEFQFREIGQVSIGQKLQKTDGLNSCLLSTSNKYGFLLIGKTDCFLFVETKNIYKMLKEKTTNTSDFTKVPTTDEHKILFLSTSSDGFTISAITSSKVNLFDARSILKGVDASNF